MGVLISRITYAQNIFGNWTIPNRSLIARLFVVMFLSGCSNDWCLEKDKYAKQLDKNQPSRNTETYSEEYTTLLFNYTHAVAFCHKSTTEDYLHAKKILDDLIESDNDEHRGARINRANILRRLDKQRAAINDYSVAIRHVSVTDWRGSENSILRYSYPMNLAAGLIGRSSSLTNTGQCNLALADLKSLDELDISHLPRSIREQYEAVSLGNYCYTYAHMGLFEKASEYCEKAVEINEEATAHIKGALLLRMGYAERADNLFDWIREKYPRADRAIEEIRQRTVTDMQNPKCPQPQ